MIKLNKYIKICLLRVKINDNFFKLIYLLMRLIFNEFKDFA